MVAELVCSRPPRAKWGRQGIAVKTAFWKKDWFIGLAVTLLFVLLADTHPLHYLDMKAYDVGVWSSLERTANDNIVVIAIDDTSIERIGQWPWSRSVLADVNQHLVAARPAVIGYTLSFDTGQNDHGLAVLRDLRDSNKKSLSKKADALLKKAIGRIDSDRRLAASFRKSGNVVLAMPYEVGREATGAKLSKTLQKHTLSIDNNPTPLNLAGLPGFILNPDALSVERLHVPIPVFSRAAAGMGLGAQVSPRQANISSVPLVMAYGEHYLPSFSLAMAAQGLGLKHNHLKVDLGGRVKLGADWMATDARLRAYPFFYKMRDDSSPFKVFSFRDVQKRKVPLKVFRDKLVLIGLTSSSLTKALVTPIGESMAPVMVMAHTISSLLNGDLYDASSLTRWGRMIGFLLVAFYLMFILPRLRLGTGLAVSGLMLIALFNAHLVLMTLKSMWVPLMVPAIALITGHLLLAGKRMLHDRVAAYKVELAESNRMLGLSFQSQGHLDMAFDKFRRCPVDHSMMELLYNLGLDYERKQQFNKAHNVYQHLAEHDSKFRDIKERLTRSKAVGETGVFVGGVGGAGAGTLIVDGEGLQKPMLGRYEIEKELGKGAMGVVYIGKDPKISRVLAIKTLALSQEFEGDKLVEVKERFFREAKTAGRLNHPNIVTIYDVGEEQDLAYIAMDYVQGEDLSLHCEPDKLLSVEEVMEITAQVAEALNYAHDQQVVHRDIKPANIIYDRENGIAKVTDFGIACLTDTRNTKTGVVLGTPSYMSPQQLSGQRVDGRSDLFSLGVTFYELLTGELPFDGESLSTLVYNIANKKHRDVRKVRSGLPPCVAQIVNKALHKDLKKRFQTGSDMAEALRNCQEKM